MARELELNVRPIFSTPLLVFSIPEAETINAELKRSVLAREASEPTYHDREVIGWSSPPDMSLMDWAGGISNAGADSEVSAARSVARKPARRSSRRAAS